MSYYLDNRRRINEHNTLYNSGEVSYRLGINKYSDVPHNEFVAQMNGFKVSLRFDLNFHVNYNNFHVKLMKKTFFSKRNANKTLIFRGDDNADIPDSIDWRNVGAVTAVKDQERCGSCWSFSSTGVVEGQHFLKTGKLVPLSEQNLIDCSQSYGNQGCNGGLMDQAFQYIRDNKGIDTEKSYRYKAANGACTFNSRNVGATVKSYVDIPSGNEDKLTEAIATIGPIAVAIDASQPSFQNYRSGIYTDENCSSKNLDHGVFTMLFIIRSFFFLFLILLKK